MPGRITIDLFTTLDGVAQAPGGPEEDTEGGFPFGGWQAPLVDDTVGEAVGSALADIDALLLGRKTYDIFAAYWPHQEDGMDSDIARQFNEVPKYVASRGAPQLDWAGSTQIGSDLASEMALLRDRHRNIHVIGSIDFAHSLLAAELYDELALWVYPIVLGQGKKVFPDGAVPANLNLLAPAITSDSGAVLLRYAPAGVPTTGDMSRPDRGV
ncbi:MAG TPA: dihydrofolate reductase family protein [Baekduia sp.]|nr:dihydrofolate reductase family protein [Baekduia sp.]